MENYSRPLWKRFGCAGMFSAACMVFFTAGCATPKARGYYGEQYPQTRAEPRTVSEESIMDEPPPVLMSRPAPGARRASDRSGGRRYARARRETRRETAVDAREDRSPAPAEETDVTKPDEEASQRAETGQRRMIIYSARLEISVALVDESIEKAVEKAESMGGYMQSRSEDVLIVRVPATHFSEFIQEITKLGETFRRQIWSQDVTKEYMDLSLRLKAAETVLKRLRELLARATNVKEALEVEKEIARVVEIIEGFKGQLRYLEQHAALSTITIRFVSPVERYRDRPAAPRRSPFRWIRRLGVRNIVQFR